MDMKLLYESSLQKQGWKVKNWKTRYFLLWNHSQHYFIDYFSTKQNSSKIPRKYEQYEKWKQNNWKGRIEIDKLSGIGDAPEISQGALKIITENRCFYLKAENETTRKDWLLLLRRIVQSIKQGIVMEEQEITPATTTTVASESPEIISSSDKDEIIQELKDILEEDEHDKFLLHQLNESTFTHFQPVKCFLYLESKQEGIITVFSKGTAFAMETFFYFFCQLYDQTIRIRFPYKNVSILKWDAENTNIQFEYSFQQGKIQTVQLFAKKETVISQFEKMKNQIYLIIQKMNPNCRLELPFSIQKVLQQSVKMLPPVLIPKPTSSKSEESKEETSPVPSSEPPVISSTVNVTTSTTTTTTDQESSALELMKPMEHYIQNRISKQMNHWNQLFISCHYCHFSSSQLSEPVNGLLYIFDQCIVCSSRYPFLVQITVPYSSILSIVITFTGNTFDLRIRFDEMEVMNIQPFSKQSTVMNSTTETFKFADANWNSLPLPFSSKMLLIDLRQAITKERATDLMINNTSKRNDLEFINNCVGNIQLYIPTTFQSGYSLPLFSTNNTTNNAMDSMYSSPRSEQSQLMTQVAEAVLLQPYVIIENYFAAPDMGEAEEVEEQISPSSHISSKEEGEEEEDATDETTSSSIENQPQQMTSPTSINWNEYMTVHEFSNLGIKFSTNKFQLLSHKVTLFLKQNTIHGKFLLQVKQGKKTKQVQLLSSSKTIVLDRKSNTNFIIRFENDISWKVSAKSEQQRSEIVSILTKLMAANQQQQEN